MKPCWNSTLQKPGQPRLSRSSLEWPWLSYCSSGALTVSLFFGSPGWSQLVHILILLLKKWPLEQKFSAVCIKPAPRKREHFSSLPKATTYTDISICFYFKNCFWPIFFPVLGIRSGLDQIWIRPLRTDRIRSRSGSGQKSYQVKNRIWIHLFLLSNQLIPFT